VLSSAPDERDPDRHDSSIIAIEQERANLENLQRVIGSDRMGEAVRLLAGTTPLGVVGPRASAALAHYFGYFARRVLPAVHTLTDAASIDDAVLQLSQQGATALLVFAMPRYPADTVAAIRLARRLGLKTVVVSDTALLSFADQIDVLLAISLLDAIANIDPRRTQQRLEAHEALVERWVHNG
jgi:DNA-binding MurR/RpiR family transcriptional regulator